MTSSLTPPVIAREPAPQRSDASNGRVRPPTRRPSRVLAATVAMRRLVSPLLLVVLWCAVSYGGFADERVFPSPSDVLSAARELLASGQLLPDVLVSMRRVGLGLVFGISAGVLLALVSGLWRVGDDIVDPVVQIVRSVPVLAISPLLTIWLGLDEAPKITIIALAVTFPIYLNLLGAIRGVDRQLVEMGRIFGLKGPALVRRVILPATLPVFLVSLRFALTICWIALIFAEQINAQSGLGFLTNQAIANVRTDILVVMLLIYAGLALTADWLIRAAESRLLVWRNGFEAK